MKQEPRLGFRRSYEHVPVGCAMLSSEALALEGPSWKLQIACVNGLCHDLACLHSVRSTWDVLFAEKLPFRFARDFSSAHSWCVSIYIVHMVITRRVLSHVCKDMSLLAGLFLDIQYPYKHSAHASSISPLARYLTQAFVSCFRSVPPAAST
jgi:hypothetical protein